MPISPLPVSRLPLSRASDPGAQRVRQLHGARHEFRRYADALFCLTQALSQGSRLQIAPSKSREGAAS